jgi:hypothetical protein
MKQGLLDNGELPLRELRGLAGLVQAVLLAFAHAAVAGEQAGLFERLVGFGVQLAQGAGDAELALQAPD